MDYLSTYHSFEDYKSGAEQYRSDDTKVLFAFADYQAAVFGHKVVPKDELAFGTSDQNLRGMERTVAEAERAAKIDAVLASAPSIAYFRYQVPLSGSVSLLASLEDLANMFDASPSFVPFRTKDGMPAMADYSKADSGVSTVYSVTAETMRKAPPRLVGSTAPKWPNRPWWVALGIFGAPVIPSSVQGLIDQANSRFGQ